MYDNWTTDETIRIPLARMVDDAMHAESEEQRLRAAGSIRGVRATLCVLGASRANIVAMTIAARWTARTNDGGPPYVPVLPHAYPLELTPAMCDGVTWLVRRCVTRSVSAARNQNQRPAMMLDGDIGGVYDALAYLGVHDSHTMVNTAYMAALTTMPVWDASCPLCNPDLSRGALCAACALLDARNEADDAAWMAREELLSETEAMAATDAAEAEWLARAEQAGQTTIITTAADRGER